MSHDAPAKPAPCPRCGSPLRGSRMLHEEGDTGVVFMVRRCSGCSLIVRRRYALKFIHQEEAPRS